MEKEKSSGKKIFLSILTVLEVALFVAAVILIIKARLTSGYEGLGQGILGFVFGLAAFVLAILGIVYSKQSAEKTNVFFSIVKGISISIIVLLGIGFLLANIAAAFSKFS